MDIIIEAYKEKMDIDGLLSFLKKESKRKGSKLKVHMCIYFAKIRTSVNDLRVSISKIAYELDCLLMIIFDLNSTTQLYDVITQIGKHTLSKITPISRLNVLRSVHTLISSIIFSK